MFKLVRLVGSVVPLFLVIIAMGGQAIAEGKHRTSAGTHSRILSEEQASIYLFMALQLGAKAPSKVTVYAKNNLAKMGLDDSQRRALLTALLSDFLKKYSTGNRQTCSFISQCQIQQSKEKSLVTCSSGQKGRTDNCSHVMQRVWIDITTPQDPDLAPALGSIKFEEDPPAG